MNDWPSQVRTPLPLANTMNLLTSFLHLIGSGATAYLLANQIRDSHQRPHVLAGFYLAESSSVPYLTALRDRAQAEGQIWLAEQLTTHANDERRHGQIFANALKQHNKEVIDFKAQAAATVTEGGKKEKNSPFFEAYYQGYRQEDLKPEHIDWQVFLGSTYILEADACHDFRRMARALEGVTDMEKVQAGILSVAEDESRHASYLKEAMHRSYDYWTVEALIDEWRSRKVDAVMAMVGNFIQQGGQTRPMAQDRTEETTSEVVDASQLVASRE
jgi:rubrerythrin